MGKLTIIGNDKPVIGKQEMYSVAAINGWLNPLQPIKNPLQVPQAHWEVMVQTKTGWRKGGSDKEGQVVPYMFGQKSLLHKGIKIVVQQGNDKGELIVHPQRAKEPKITRVELLDANYKPIPKGKKLSYKDTIIARAYCVEMFGMNIAFTLWEDDAQGEGHNPTVNALNKINPVPVLSRVNEKGMAEAVFRLPFYTMAVLIANARTASGDKSEGSTHEYYVTADVVSKHIQKASPNVNVVNPTHSPEPPRKRELPKGNTPTPAKPKTTPVPEKPKPKPKPDGNSAKFPVTTGGKKSDDPQGKILSAEFVDNNGNRLHSSKVGATVFMKITAKDMKNKKVKVKIWEEDNIKWTNDLIFEQDYELLYDTNFIWIVLTKKMFIEGNDGGSDSAKQDYFIEVIHNDISVKSAVMPVSVDAEPTRVESGDSATMVEKTKLKTKNCGGKYCIDKNSPPSELIREINIRLAGFGGNVPTDKFTDRTEKMIKQFQRDYMKVPETGKVCGNVLKAIDEFQSKFTIDFTEIKCKCKKCTGFGTGKYGEEKQKSNIAELNRKYEYPGVHKSLLWGFRALNFYLSNKEKNLNYTIKCIFSGYRCWNDNLANNRNSTNHMGKAIDIHFNKNGQRTQSIEDMEKIRDKVIIPHMGGQLRWGKNDKFSVEPTRKAHKKEFIATTWIHLDVRQFQIGYLEDKYFAKDTAKLNGKNIVALAMELGFNNTCSCMGTRNSSTTDKANEIKNDRVDPKTLVTSQRGKDFIKDWEKYHKMPYNDSEGYATIGYGYLLAYKSYKNLTKSEVEKTDITWKEFKEGITKERALEIFEDKVKKYEKAMYRDVTVKLYQHEFDALVSLLFNCGPDFLKNRKAPKLYNNLLNEKYEDAANEFLDITNDGTGGLIKRRKAENDMFLNNNYDSTN